MNKTNKTAIFILILINLVFISCFSSIQDEDRLILSLRRKSIPGFEKIRRAQSDTQTNRDNSKKSYINNVESLKDCGDDVAKITKEYVDHNVMYLVEATFGEDKKTFELALDLQSPWTWVKNEHCILTNFDGRQQTKNKSEICEVQGHSKYFTCNTKTKCEVVNKCAELNVYNEGMFMAGKFVDTQMKFNDLGKYDLGLRSQRIVVSHALKIFKTFQADGVLGLGRNIKRIETNSVNYKNNKEEQDWEKEMKYGLEEFSGDLRDGQSYKNIDYYQTEEKTNVIENFVNRLDRSIHKEMFSIYIAENYEEYFDTNYDSHIEFGGEQTDKYLLHPGHGAVKWADIDHSKTYYEWELNIKQIEIYKNGYMGYKNYVDITSNQRPTTIKGFNQSGVLSLSTTSFMLPRVELDEIIEIIEDSHNNVKCSIQEKYFHKVLCTGLSSPMTLDHLIIAIMLTQGGEIVINPKELVSDCQKNNGSYECLLNLAESLDGHTILGESVLKNYYWMFDVEFDKVGFGLAKTKYNQKLFSAIEEEVVETVKEVVKETEEDLEFILRFWFIIVFTIMALVCFRKSAFFAQMARNFFGLGKSARRQRRIPFDDMQDNYQQQQHRNEYNQVRRNIVGEDNSIQVLNQNEEIEFQDMQDNDDNEREKKIQEVKNLKEQFADFDQQTMESQKAMQQGSSQDPFEHFDRDMQN